MNQKSYRSLANLSTVQTHQQSSSIQRGMHTYDEKHRRLFSRPALTCELCGYPMNYNGHKLTPWEQKWSTHEVCRDKALQMLDRQSGITRERRRRRR
jgi:hypothetical protein